MDAVAAQSPPAPPAARAAWRQHAGPAALFAAVPVCLFLPITLSGCLVFGSSDLYFHLLNRLYPVVWVKQAGLVPWWNPFVNAGMPFVGDQQCVLFSPYAPLYYLLPVHWALFAAYLVSFFLAGFGAYLFLRQLGARLLPATFGGLVFGLNSVLISQVFNGNIHHLNTYALVPFAFLALELGLAGRRTRPFVVVALLLALMLYSGHAQYVLYTGTVLGLYLVARGWQLGVPLRWSLPRFALTAGLALGLAAAQLLPSWEFRQWSNRAGGLPYEVVARDSLPFQNLLLFVMPFIFGCPGTNTLWQTMDYSSTNVYFGVVSFVLAGLAVARAGRRDRLVWLFFGLWVFAVLMALGRHTPVYGLFYRFVPGYDTFRGPGRIQVFVGFAQAALACFALEQLLRADDAEARARRVLAWMLGLGLVAVLVGGLLYAFRAQVFAWLAPYGEKLLHELYYTWKRGLAHPFEYHLQRMPVAVNLAISQGLRAALLGVGTAGLAWFALRAPAARRTGWAGALLALLLLDLVSFAQAMVKPCPPDVYFGSHPALDYLRRHPTDGRVLWHDGVLQYQGGMFDQTQDVRAYNPVVIRRYLEFLAANDGRPYEPDLFYSWLDKPDGPLVRLLNVRYYLRGAGEPHEPCANWRPVASFPGLRFRHVEYKDFQMIFPAKVEVFEAVDPLPRAWFVGRGEPVPPESPVLERLLAPGFDARAVAYYETADAGRGVGAATPGPAAPGSTAALTAFSPDRLSLAVDTPVEQFLVVSEVFYPGWEAYVDGRPTPIYRTDHILRGLVVPAGAHTVEFVYRPGSVRGGLALAGLALAVTAGLLVALRPRAETPTPR